MKLLLKHINGVRALQYIQLLRFATLFVLGIIFVRYYNTRTIGQYETLTMVAGAVTFFWLRGILQSFLTNVNYKNPLANKQLYFNGFLIMMIFSLLAVIFLIVFKTSLQKILTHGQPIAYFKWLLFYVLFSAPTNLIEYIYLGNNQHKHIIVYGTVSFAIQFFAMVIPALLGFGILQVIISLVIISALRFVFLIFCLIKYSIAIINRQLIINQLSKSGPLIGSALLSGSAQYIDGFLITYYFDESMLAIFRYGARELPIVFILANAMSNAMLPEFNSNNNLQALQKLKKSANRLMHLFMPACIILLATSNYIFPIVFSADYALSAKVFNIYLLLAFLRLLFPQTILIGNGHTRMFLWVSFIEIIVNITSSLILINYLGIIGVAFGTLIAFTTEKIILIYNVKKRLNISINQYINLKWYSFYLLCSIVVYLIFDYIIF